MSLELLVEEVAQEFRVLLDRLTYFPDEDFLKRFPFGEKLLRDANKVGGLDLIYNFLDKENYFQDLLVPIPSIDQMLSGIEIGLAGISGQKRFELSKPGTRKTIGLLSSIPVINEVLLKELGYENEKVKTLICCPTYIIPTWIRETERLFLDPNIVVVTRKNRMEAIRRASEDEVDIVLLGYELSHRKTGIDFEDPVIADEITQRREELLFEIRTKDDAYKRLEPFLSKKRIENIERRDFSFSDLIKKIVIEEKNYEAASIANCLQKKVFPSGGKPYAVFLDEIHNIINPSSKTGIALSEIYKNAFWGCCSTGTGIKNKLSNLSFLAYLNDYIADPKDFPSVFKNNPKIIKAMFDLGANPINKLEDIDDQIPDPIFIDKEMCQYDLSSDEMDVYIAISNHEGFEGKDQYLLLSYLLANPERLAPEYFEETGNDDSLRNKIDDFYDLHPHLLEKIKKILPSKIKKVREIVRLEREKGEKIVVVTEYTGSSDNGNLITELLENKLSDFGCVRIDKDVSAQMGEILISKDERGKLLPMGLINGSEKYRSDLSLKARKELNINSSQIWIPSPRHLSLLEFQTNPEVGVLVSTYGTLREGTDVQEASVLIEYDITTVPSHFEQMLARIRRSGQDKQLKVYQINGKNTFEIGKLEYREWKKYRIDEVFEGEEPSPEELSELLEDTTPERSKHISSLLQMNSRSVVAMMFGNLRGVGVDHFIEEMNAYNNALFLAKNYNWKWESSRSSNVAKLAHEIIYGLENKIGRTLNDCIDEGCGPATMSRVLGRPFTCIDLNRFQMDYGIDACEEKMIVGNEYYLGSYTDLSNLIKHTTEEEVFNLHKQYEKKFSIENNSKDLAICSDALDFATMEERKYFFQENKRVLREGGYLMIINPTSKVDKSCRDQFLQDVDECGFVVDRELTGTYIPRRTINLDTGEEESNVFEAYIILARNKDENDSIKFHDGRDYFVMMPEYEIKEGPSNMPEERVGEIKGNGDVRNYNCQDFYNIDVGIDPKNVRPIQEEDLVHDDLSELNHGVNDMAEDEFLKFERELNNILNSDH